MEKLVISLLMLGLCMFVQIIDANTVKRIPDIIINNNDDKNERHKRHSEESCVYTFHVAPTESNTCPPGSNVAQNNPLDELKNSITLQHATLIQKLEALTSVIEKLNIMEKNNTDQDSEENMNEGNEGPQQRLGTHYTRWGSSSCPNTAELIYAGFAGKSYFTHGGGVNYLCLPEDPEFPENASSGTESQSYIYGVEYERHGSPLVPQEKHDDDVPCAVCHVTGRGEQLMIPAKTSCPTSWNHEYDGILMAQHNTHKGSDYICVDKSMEVLHGGTGDSNGGLLYTVEAQCGSLKCPPYENGKEIVCAVCTL